MEHNNIHSIEVRLKLNKGQFLTIIEELILIFIIRVVKI